MSQKPFEKLDFEITKLDTTGGKQGPSVVHVAFILPNGIRLTCTLQGVQSRNLDANRALKLFHEIRHFIEKDVYHYAEYGDREFLIPKEELNRSCEAIVNLIFRDIQVPKDLRERVDDVYECFQENAEELLDALGSLNEETQIEVESGTGKTFYLVRTGDSTFDIRLRVKKVGAGSFKKVYETYSIVDGVRRALAMPRKRAAEGGVDRAAAIAAIDHEVAIAKELKGVKYVAKPTKVTSPDGQSAVMYSEFCDHRDLVELLSSGDVSTGDLKRILLHTAEGVDGMHDCGICHNDLKPENIGITAEGEPLLFDFGGSTRTTEKITPRGTGRFMAPEMVVAAETEKELSASRTMDVFSYGCLLYECLSWGGPLFEDTEGVPLPQGNRQYCEQMEETLRKTGKPLAILVADCIKYDPRERLLMTEFVERLKEIPEEDFGHDLDIRGRSETTEHDLPRWTV